MRSPADIPLNAPARYFPPAGGKYRIEPGLSKFGKDFGNGAADAQVFQIDDQLPDYRAAKLAARRERLGKYFQTRDLATEVAAAVTRFMIGRLTAEYPRLFERHDGQRHITLACRLTGEVLEFDDSMRLVRCDARPSPPYACALDALACQVQEDMAVVSSDPRHQDIHWLSAIHLCFPNHWAAEDKIGRTFAAVHEPVAGIEPVNRRAGHLVRTMLAATDGLVRFAWGLTADPRLNHHPRPAADAPPAVPFDPSRPGAYVRVERQTMWGLEDTSASLFTIRTYLLDCADLSPSQRLDLASAVESMTAESLAYKGLVPWKDAIVAWLRSDARATAMP